MKPTHFLLRILATAALSLSLYCGSDGPVAGGSDSEDFEGYGFNGSAVYADNTPAVKAAVSVHPYDSYGSNGSATVLTDTNGAFTVTGLQPGTYTLTILDSLDNGVSLERNLSGTGLTQLGSPVLTPTGALAGTLALDDTNPDLYPLWVRIRGIWKSASTNSAGAYSITGIPAGAYTVRIESPWPANTSYGIAETSVVITSGETARLTMAGLPLRNTGGTAYTQDSLIVQEILDSNGITDPISAFTHVLDSRIVSFHDFNGAVTRLPACIGGLDQLEVLILMNGAVTVWPMELASLTNLKKLSLIKQGLSSLPVPFTDLTSLVSLNLSGNGLGTLPEPVFTFKDLHFLYADSCGLTALQPEIADLALLNGLYLRNNALSSIPSKITDLKNMTTLLVAGNYLCSLPDDLMMWLGTIDADWDTAGQCD